jgi:hypothetical protein
LLVRWSQKRLLNYYRSNLAPIVAIAMQKRKAGRVDFRTTKAVLLKITQANIKIKKLLPNESSLVILISVNYFFFKNVSTSSGVIILSTKVYAPVFGDFTILIAFVNLLEDVCKVATVFFAMTYMFYWKL